MSDDQSAKKYRYIWAMLGKKVDICKYVILRWGARTFSQKPKLKNLKAARHYAHVAHASLTKSE
jgi:hypothetical protein